MERVGLRVGLKVGLKVGLTVGLQVLGVKELERVGLTVALIH